MQFYIPEVKDVVELVDKETELIEEEFYKLENIKVKPSPNNKIK